jgi:HPt (histidine-containing phosphotransfer) domain-containing protein
VTDVALAIEQLRVRFRTRAASDMVDLRRWSKAPSEHQAELHALVHRLAGAAGTFGFHRLSEVAARAEDAIITDAPGRSAAIAEVVDELECVIDQAALDCSARSTAGDAP